MSNSLVQKIKKLGPVEAHRSYKKVITLPACPVDFETLSTWYTPGVADPCREIMKNPDEVWALTARENRIAIVSDGTRILGLRSEGVCGAEPSLPVMEGKALLFRALGAVDAVPLTIGWRDKIPTGEEIINIVKMVQANFAGVNLEDIEAKDDKCFKVLDGLRDDEGMNIPVWHDDQQGTATVALAAVINALKLSKKKKEDIQIACIGSGAAMLAIIRLLVAWGVSHKQIRLVDSKGIVDESRDDIDDNTEKGKLKSKVQQLEVMGDEKSKKAAIKVADVLVAASASKPGGIIDPELVKTMVKDPIVITMANPYPELDPKKAKENGAFIVGTGRSDFPNQVNNSLAFPGIFRGILDCRASTITDSVAVAAAEAIAARAREISEFGSEFILPKMDDVKMVVDTAVAAGFQATEEKLARKPLKKEAESDYRREVEKRLSDVRDMIDAILNIVE